MGIIPVVVFLVLAAIGLPIALVMIVAGLSGAISVGGIGFIEIIADRFYAGVAGFLLIAVPYFIFTAELMNRAKLTDRLVAFANSLFGKAPGALSHVNVIVSILFAGLTGAAVTDTVAIGKTLIPAMKREGYHADYAAAVTACSSIIGPIIPPKYHHGGICGHITQSITHRFVCGRSDSGADDGRRASSGKWMDILAPWLCQSHGY